MAHTLTIVEPIWPMLQNVSKTLIEIIFHIECVTLLITVSIVTLFAASRKGKPNPPVKFSLNPDLERDECLRLLEKYTPTHMKNNKTSQKLFVR